jgi:hypothetical protein
MSKVQLNKLTLLAGSKSNCGELYWKDKQEIWWMMANELKENLTQSQLAVFASIAFIFLSLGRDLVLIEPGLEGSH